MTDTPHDSPDRWTAEAAAAAAAISVIAVFVILAVSLGATIVGTIYINRRVREIEDKP